MCVCVFYLKPMSNMLFYHVLTSQTSGARPQPLWKREGPFSTWTLGPQLLVWRIFKPRKLHFHCNNTCSKLACVFLWKFTVKSVSMCWLTSCFMLTTCSSLCSSTSGTSEALPAAKPKQVQRRKRGPAAKSRTLPKSYLMSTFRHFAKAKVSADVYPVLDEV